MSRYNPSLAREVAMADQTTRRNMLAAFAGTAGMAGAASAAGAAADRGHGGSELDVGLWANFDSVAVPMGVSLVRTSGYDHLGLGMAAYVLDENQTSQLEAPWRKRSVNGRWFRLPVQGDVDLTWFGGRSGPGFDNTAAMTAVAHYLDAQGGGVIRLPFAAEWHMNWVCLANNIKLWGCGGNGENDLYCVRPFRLDAPAIQFGDGRRLIRSCGLFNVHVSGTNATPQSVRNSAGNAPRTVVLNGGAVDFRAENCVFYNGVATISLIPSPQFPVTAVVFQNCTIRNDLADSAEARAIYLTRLGAGLDEGYLTSVQWNGVKLNGPSKGYAVEVDGARGGILLEVTDGYWDVKPDHGILMKGSSSVLGFNLQLDPGVNGAVVIETDQVIADPTRLIAGVIRHGGQKWRDGRGLVFALPDEADFYVYQPTLRNPYVRFPIHIATSSDAHSTAARFDARSDVGPMDLVGMDLSVRALTQADDLDAAALHSQGGIACKKTLRVGGDVFVYGSTGAPIGILHAQGAAFSVSANGVNRHIRLEPSGVGQVQLGGSGLQPVRDNAQDCGGPNNRFAVIRTGTATINTSDAAEKLSSAPDLFDPETGLLTDLAMRVVARVPVRAFRWLSAIAEKQDGARVHLGWYAQDWESAFKAEGLDPANYALWCADPITEAVTKYRTAVRIRRQLVSREVDGIEIVEGKAIRVKRIEQIEEDAPLARAPLFETDGVTPVLKPVAGVRPESPDMPGERVRAAQDTVYEQETCEIPGSNLEVYWEAYEEQVPKLGGSGQPMMRLGLRTSHCISFILAYHATRLAALEARTPKVGANAV
jgi:hypothetical protein